MRLALVADVHANLAAWEAVREAIEAEGVDCVVCLGDLVGYNAEPSAVLDGVRAFCDVVVAGNHDREVEGAATRGTSSAARAALAWTQGKLREESLAWLAALPGRVVDQEAGFVALHGCFLNETFVNGYVTETMLPANLAAIAQDDLPRVAFCGHTHVSMVAWLEQGVVHPKGVSEVQWAREARAVLVNPGSVGQPRDGDPRAAFAIADLEARTVALRRVRYDVERAVSALAAAGLPNELGARLREGR